jgi:hypothetical protein
MFQIDLTPSGELQLHMPGGRAIEITASAEGVMFIKKVIADHNRGIRNQPRYIGTLPTQAAADKFLKEKRARVAKEEADKVKEKAKSLNIDWDKMEINL